MTKPHPVESLSISVMNSLKAVNLHNSAPRLGRSPSARTGWRSTMLRNLKPRFLEGLTSHDLKSVLAAAKFREFEANSVITNQERPAERLYLLLSGRARFFFVTEKGHKVILLWIPPGEIFGSAALRRHPPDITSVRKR